MLIPKQVGESKVLKQRPLTLPVDADTSLGGFGSNRESNTDEKVFFLELSPWKSHGLFAHVLNYELTAQVLTRENPRMQGCALSSTVFLDSRCPVRADRQQAALRLKASTDSIR